MAIPDHQSLMLPVLVASAKGEVRIGSVVEELADQLKLSPEERSELLPSGKQTVFSNRVHWAKSYLSKAHLVEITRRGYFRITPRGQTVLGSQPSHIDNKFLSQFEEFRQFRERSGGTVEADSETVIPASDAQKQTPDETMRMAHRQIDSALGQDLLDRIREAPPDFFERLIVNLLLSMGYGGTADHAGRTLGRSGDDGEQRARYDQLRRDVLRERGVHLIELNVTEFLHTGRKRLRPARTEDVNVLRQRLAAFMGGDRLIDRMDPA
jgi:restriction system protein